MIPYKDLLSQPEKYRPLGSVKSVNNIPSRPDFTDIDIAEVFRSDSNMHMMANSLYKVHRQNGGRLSIEKFLRLTPKLANNFMQKYSIYEFEDVDFQATGQHNWVELLRTINNEFVNYCYKWFKWNQFVPTREWGEVGPIDNRKQKRFYEMTADDIPTLDYWRNQEIQRMNKVFRYHNKIPFWQKTMHRRHHDRENEGFRYDDSDRSSLETPIHHAYDMSDIHKTLDKWTKTEWFGME